jgi:hypothetical protein
MYPTMFLAESNDLNHYIVQHAVVVVGLDHRLNCFFKRGTSRELGGQCYKKVADGEFVSLKRHCMA